jgi:hypothetical protein
MNNVDRFISHYFSDAMSIAAICSDEGFSRDDARLFTYIHVKSKNSPSGTECFNGEGSEEISALKIMLGKKSFSSLIGKNASTHHALEDFSEQVVGGIKNIDFAAQEGCGVELYLRSELVHRLKFHSNETYRNEMLAVYKKTILPKIKAYNGKKIFEAFEKKRRESEMSQLKQADLFN